MDASDKLAQLVHGVILLSTTASDTSRALSRLLESDIVLLVLDPIRLLDTPEITAILPDLLGKPDVYFVINGEIESNGLRDVGASLDQEQARRVTLKSLEDQLQSSRSAFGLERESATDKIVFLSTHKALRSMDALRSTLTTGETSARSSSEHAFAKFKAEYLESNLGAVSASLLGDIRAVRERADRLGAVYEATYTWLADSVSRHIARNLADVLDETREIEALCAQHAELLSRTRQELRRDTFTSGEAIKEEMDRAKRGVEEVLRKRLVWWKVMSWRVDMVAEEVGREVEERWAVELTQKVSCTPSVSVSETFPDANCFGCSSLSKPGDSRLSKRTSTQKCSTCLLFFRRKTLRRGHPKLSTLTTRPCSSTDYDDWRSKTTLHPLRS
jgi:hypothetical protein